jgi:hypothetical protein
VELLHAIANLVDSDKSAPESDDIRREDASRFGAGMKRNPDDSHPQARERSGNK